MLSVNWIAFLLRFSKAKMTSMMMRVLIYHLLVQLTLGCSYDENDSPILRIETYPREYDFSGKTNNITVICMVKGKSDQPVPNSNIKVLRNGTKLSQKYNEDSSATYNLTLFVAKGHFGNRSKVTVNCFGKSMTGSCTRVNKELPIKFILPTARPTSSHTSNDSPSGIGFGIIIALAVSCLALFIGIVTASVVYRKHLERQRALRAIMDPFPAGHEQDPFAVPVGPPNSRYTVPVYPADVNELEYCKDQAMSIGNGYTLFVPEDAKILGSGKFGAVCLGTIMCDNANTKERNVAVKMLKAFDNTKHRRDFEKEVESLKKLNHPNIVKMIDTYIDKDKFYIIMEYLEKGSLLSLLQREKERISQRDLTRFAGDIACGMHYLSGNRIVHRDLAARNVLISDDGSAKISDFGMARDIDEKGLYEPTQGGYIPVKWASLEALESQRFTVESDVWSYGIVLWEIFSYGKDPYEFMSHHAANVFDLRDFLKTGKRLEMPGKCPHGVMSEKRLSCGMVWTSVIVMYLLLLNCTHLECAVQLGMFSTVGRYLIMQRCWSPVPEQRPTFAALINWAESMMDTFDGRPTENDD